MPTQEILLVAFIAAAVYGAVVGFTSLRGIRQHHPYADVILSWYEAPLSSFKYERSNWVAVTFHSAAIVVIGLVTLVQFRESLALPEPFSTLSPWLLPLVFGVVAGGTAYIGFVWALTITSPVARRMAGKSHYALSDDGLLFGGLLFPWEAFDRFSVDPGQATLRLWSAFSPMTVSFTLTPRPDLVEDLGSRLKSSGASSPATTLGALAFPISMILVSCFGVFLIGGTYLAVGWLATPLCAILLSIFIRATAWLMFKFSSNGRQRLAPMDGPAA
jgi:hypothetical protein